MINAKEAKEIMEKKRSQKIKKKPTKRALKKIERFIREAAKAGDSSAIVCFDDAFWDRDEIISELRKLNYIVRSDYPYIYIHWN